MAQTAANFRQEAGCFDYTPGADVAAGAVLVVAGILCVTKRPILSGVQGAVHYQGVFAFPKESGAIAYGDKVLWKPAGTPVTGDASSGAASNSGGTYYAGTCVKAAASGDSYVDVAMGLPMVNDVPVAVVAATGSTQANAAQLIKGFNHVTGADATKGVLLPVATPGAVVEIKNADAANAILKIWPASGDAINAITADSSMSIAAKTSVRMVAIDGTTWFTIPLLPS